MEWQDQGIVLSSRRHGETSAVVSVLTRGNGVHSGLVRGGWGRRSRHMVEPGNRVHARWRGRLAEHLGSYTLEVERSFSATLMDEPIYLSAMTSALALSAGSMAEREAHPQAFDGLSALLDILDSSANLPANSPDWQSAYVKWEMGLLGELGYGLDFSECAATGTPENLIYVSPKSGRAVSKSAGEPYKNSMLPLPEFVKASGGVATSVDEILSGLKLSGHFLERHVFNVGGRHLPQARGRFIARISRQNPF
ncbi:MAG: DNA repair protein RecO [Rhodospirillaceae bacterium]|nr:DNA repair protein RecO [Rhodospirillaceae bacterium]